MEAFIKYLLEPKPANCNTLKKSIINAVVFGTFIGLFLVAFKPFRLNELSAENTNLKIFGYGLVTFVVELFSYALVPLIFSKMYQNWNIIKEVLYAAWNLFLIAAGNWYYTNLVADSLENTGSLIDFVYVTLIVGLMPITIFYLYQQKTEMSKSLKSLQVSLETNGNSAVKENVIELKGDTKKSVKVPFKNLIFVESFGNYCNIHFDHDGLIKKEIIRNSLKNIEQQLQEFEQIIRCHKSYLVNLEHLSKVNGNTKGYQLQLNNLEMLVPVSRNYPIQNIKTFAN